MPQDFAPFHTCVYLANVTDEINSFRVSVELCLRLKFRARTDQQHELCDNFRVPTVREKSGKNEKISRSGKSQGILSLVREICNFGKSQGKVREF